MPKPLRFSEVSVARQRLIRICQSTNYGHIHYLTVECREPVLKTPPLVILADVRLDIEDHPRDETSLDDFLLCAEFCRLMSILDEILTGTISSIEVRGGVPRRVTFEKQITQLQSPVVRQAGSKDPSTSRRG
jgi:hypothetical protein